MSDLTVNKYMIETINKYADALKKIERELPYEFWDRDIYKTDVVDVFININHIIREALYQGGRTGCAITEESFREMSLEKN